MFKKILLATDGSENAFHAAKTAINVAQSTQNATIYIVYVIEFSNAKTDILQNWNSNELDKQRQEKIQSTVELIKASGINYRTRFLRGEPGSALVKYANEGYFDLVIVGNGRKNKLQELLVGSVSHKVAKGATSPVMIVKAQEFNKSRNVSAYFSAKSQ
ncbi:universal stress protein [Alkalihalobacterium alkalinitrilicum]|uniref:universal stress protein n=1 Tax=Alkalihalobacterium alkalinitrilicum TaxID=427920 RepID=UPI000995A1BC|nr:universal stress protein [Alkalihalobacterium alkalinitrilicum]